jgi:hypothetical protein
MKPALLFLLSDTIGLAGFGPNVRIDRGTACSDPAITVGPSLGQTQPLYVVFADQLNVVFQKSTDAGATWLADNRVVCQGSIPDVTTDADGNIFIVCPNGRHVYCTGSTDRGATWSAPARVDDNDAAYAVGWAHVTSDTAGHLFCAWDDSRLGCYRIWSSVSSDLGATWSPNVRVDDDTTNHDCRRADVFVQPGTNHYLVAASIPHLFLPNVWTRVSYLYRSTDMGQTYEPGVRIDTLVGSSPSTPYVVADPQHVICDYSDGFISEARTLFTQPDTWGRPCSVSTSYLLSNKLAVSADGRVHMTLLSDDSICYLVYYSYSYDHGVAWSDRELVTDDTTGKWRPDIGADSAGNVYLVWEDKRSRHDEVWFSTNNPAGIAERSPMAEFRSESHVEPNPFNKGVTLSLNSYATRSATARVYAQDGRMVKQAQIPAGEARWVWDGRDDSGAILPPGVYVVEAGPGLRAKVVKLK